jgi:type IV pilus assembly protein PilA
MTNLMTKNTGFTLIELLVSIVIIGILSAIALPGFLNQAAKTRASEAKSILGAINRSQQAYRLQNGTFAGQIIDLDTRASGKYYDYQINAADVLNASATASTLDVNLKSYSSAVAQTNNDFFGQVICESLMPNTLAGPATAPINPGQKGSCDPSARLID